MPEFLMRDILDWTSGIPAGARPVDPDLVIRGVCCDSRSIIPGCLFIALHGQNHDGHQFLGPAAASGAAALLIDDLSALENLEADLSFAGRLPPAILTGDTLRALQNLAAVYRQALPGKVIGITGSVGKTSTRQMVGACLGSSLRIHQTSNNLNNEIGLPQTLLQAEPDHQAIILEMGMRGPGEISLLSRISRPDLAMITAIGSSHIGRLGSREAILSAKAEILEGLGSDGMVILNADDPYLFRLGTSIAGRRRLAWISTAERLEELLKWPVVRTAEFLVLAHDIGIGPDQTNFTASLAVAGHIIREIQVNLPFPGEHHISNMLFGLAAAYEFGIDLKLAAAGAAGCRFAGSRQRILQDGSITIMDDSYNASPESMLAAMKVLSAQAGTNRRMAAALGGMLEMGDFAAEAHREIGVQAAQRGFAALFVIGPHGKDVSAGAHSVNPSLPVSLYDGHAEMSDAILAWLRPGDCLLIKGSRGFAMEKVTDAVLQGLPQTGEKH